MRPVTVSDLEVTSCYHGCGRLPREKDDPACALPALPELVQAIKDAEQADAKRPGASSMGTGV